MGIKSHKDLKEPVVNHMNLFYLKNVRTKLYLLS